MELLCRQVFGLGLAAEVQQLREGIPDSDQRLAVPVHPRGCTSWPLILLVHLLDLSVFVVVGGAPVAGVGGWLRCPSCGLRLGLSFWRLLRDIRSSRSFNPNSPPRLGSRRVTTSSLMAASRRGTHSWRACIRHHSLSIFCSFSWPVFASLLCLGLVLLVFFTIDIVFVLCDRGVVALRSSGRSCVLLLFNFVGLLLEGPLEPPLYRLEVLVDLALEDFGSSLLRWHRLVSDRRLLRLLEERTKRQGLDAACFRLLLVDVFLLVSLPRRRRALVNSR